MTRVGCWNALNTATLAVGSFFGIVYQSNAHPFPRAVFVCKHPSFCAASIVTEGSGAFLRTTFVEWVADVTLVRTIGNGTSYHIAEEKRRTYETVGQQMMYSLPMVTWLSVRTQACVASAHAIVYGVHHWGDGSFLFSNLIIISRSEERACTIEIARKTGLDEIYQNDRTFAIIRM